jgi:hypothetical protein
MIGTVLFPVIIGIVLLAIVVNLAAVIGWLRQLR